MAYYILYTWLGFVFFPAITWYIFLVRKDENTYDNVMQRRTGHWSLSCDSGLRCCGDELL